MRLLLDQNLSHRLKGPLDGVYPGIAHVRDFGLERADDSAVWDFAADLSPADDLRAVYSTCHERS